ncbi:Eco47II family restriction endonuclease [Algoriphagus persicinus]|uniref:Eco47II family restriction endonuclease n=1 Tax=Algoriphagus persicinus TaxID=3108754 RepID=UPI002B39A07E|nr:MULTISPECIES: Eco47II family restriction endonuclease [unclassified Algoriphagus]MEB2780357.1 Eco47II family restriction endonuclease [Algoriphagus sp. C2-6-M1]MEB2784559.1 Eco47II family restriction endonuclease [Algoriphagus sp. E1-3-M2]
MPYLEWIADEELEKAVTKLVGVAKDALVKSQEDFTKNVIDPFSAIFQVAGFGIDYNTWLVSEQTRQAQKSMQNHVGSFHQTILGGVEGWEDLTVGHGVDLVCSERKIIAEVKNKYNTVTGGKLADQYYMLERLVTPKASRYKDFTAYFVAVIPKNSIRYDVTFEPSDKDKGMKCPKNELIRQTDGASFYELVTGDPDALRDLFEVLPEVLENIDDFKFTAEDKSELSKFFEMAYGD